MPRIQLVPAKWLVRGTMSLVMFALVAVSPAVHAQDASEAAAHAKALSKAFRLAAEKMLPTVVKIRTQASPASLKDHGDVENPFRGTPFGDLFERQLERMPAREGVGSGVIIDSKGTILTNNHVVEGADELTVVLADGREYKAINPKTDPQTDIAVIQIEGAGSLPAAALGNSDELEIGDWVIAIGSPFELEQTVSAGIISGKGRELGAVERAKFLQTDAAINPGNSGGPLVNLDGEVVGINTAIASSSGGYQGIGFAIPINTAKWVVGQLIDRGSVQRAYLGVQIRELNLDVAEQLGLARNAGVLVAQVIPDSPADEAGFVDGDLIVRIAGTEVRKPRDLQEIVERMPLGSRQEVHVLRARQPVVLQVVLREMPNEVAKTATPAGRRTSPSTGRHVSNSAFGLAVAELTPELAARLGYEDVTGVLVTEVTPNGLADKKGLRPGTLIRRIGDKQVTGLQDFEQALEGTTPRSGIVVLIRLPNGAQDLIVLKQ
ncbi:MAG: Do family serine endopeptidase [Pirellulales bacterium]|nr:Do family serine endopeptidase [Pirellulales bacterium]